MTISPTNTAVQSAEMNPNQQAFVTKAGQIVARVVFQALTTLVQSSKMEPAQFIATHIEPMQKPLSELDERTSRFFRKMMEAINPAIDSIPTLKSSFQIFETVTGETQLCKKFVEGIALPHVKTMINELDAIQPSIVDDVIAS
jgi:hypothetical protein